MSIKKFIIDVFTAEYMEERRFQIEMIIRKKQSYHFIKQICT